MLIMLHTVYMFASSDAIESARDNCTQVESPLNVAGACESHINCLFETATVNCIEGTLVNLIQNCSQFELSLCVDIATLTLIAMEAAILDYQTMDTTSQLNNSLQAFVEGDYQTAIDLYENITLALDYFPHYILELGLGVIYLRFDNPDVALIQFDKSLNLEFYNPIAFYYRGNTYEQRDNEVRALRDHYLYDLLAETPLKATLPLRSFRIQISNSEPWNLYPIYALEQNGEQFLLRDSTLEPVQPIVVALVDGQETLVIAEWLDIVAGTDTEIIFLERDPENPLRYILNINQQDTPDNIPSGKTEISIVVSPFLLEIYLDSTQGTDRTLITSIANRIDESDIRDSNPKRICDGTPLSLLKLEDEIELTATGAELTLWDDPIVEVPLINVDLGDEDTKPFRIVDRAVCYEGQIWWQVSNGNLGGWLPENQLVPEYSYAIMASPLLHIWRDNSPSPLEFLNFNSQEN